MKSIRKKLIVLFYLTLVLPPLGFAQKGQLDQSSCKVYINYPPLSITKEQLKEARTLMDLNKKYRSEWIKEYLSVEILTSHKGEIRKAASNNEVLRQEQKDHLNTADLGTDIWVKVLYLPDNTLTHNDPREMSFSFTVEPENGATYPGGPQQLTQYLKENILDKMADASLKQYQLAAVTFTIDEEGHITDPRVFWTSEDEKTDKLLLDAVCNMPNWTPAAYANGQKVKQELVLTLGDLESCVVNLLNIRQE